MKIEWSAAALADLSRFEDFLRERYPALSAIDLASPAEASSPTTVHAKGFAQAGNRYPLFGIMRQLRPARRRAR